MQTREKRGTISILGIETSCDETAAAVVTDGRIIKSSVVATQTKLHEKYGGVVPEIASRAHIENIYPVTAEAIKQAGSSKDDIDAIAVANQPGLTVALVVGVTAAKTLSFIWNKPLIAINHLTAAVIQHGSFDAAERKIKRARCEHRTRKFDCPWVSLFGQFFDAGSAGIGQFKNRCHFVKSFTCSVVDSRAEKFGL